MVAPRRQHQSVQATCGTRTSQSLKNEILCVRQQNRADPQVSGNLRASELMVWPSFWKDLRAQGSFQGLLSVPPVKVSRRAFGTPLKGVLQNPLPTGRMKASSISTHTSRQAYQYKVSADAIQGSCPGKSSDLGPKPQQTKRPLAGLFPRWNELFRSLTTPGLRLVF